MLAASIKAVSARSVLLCVIVAFAARNYAQESEAVSLSPAELQRLNSWLSRAARIVSFLPGELVKVWDKNDVLLFCEVDGNPIPTIRWMKNDRNIPVKNNRFETMPYKNDFGSVLRIRPARPGRSRENRAVNYTCVADNQVSDERTAVVLVLDRPNEAMPNEAVPNGYPSAAVTPETVTSVELGHSIFLQCTTAGYPKPSVIWLFEDRPVTANQRTSITPESLTIQNAVAEDTGRYSCYVWNEKGVNMSNEVRVYTKGSASTARTDRAQPKSAPAMSLALSTTASSSRIIHRYERKAAPYFTIRPPEKVEVAKGEPVTLNCQANGYPPPSVYWLTENRPVGDQKTATNHLTIDRLFQNANYTCVASSQFGRISTNSYVIVKDFPAAVRNLRTLQIQARQVILTWDPNLPSDEVTSYGLSYRAIQDRVLGGAQGQEYEISNLKDVKVSVTKLEPYTKFEFRAVAHNAVGRSPLSDALLVTTGEDDPETPPSQVNTYLMNEQTVLVSWLPPAKPNGAVRLYKIYYEVVPNGEATIGVPINRWKSVEVPGGVGGAGTGSTMETVLSLVANYTYEIVMCAATVGDCKPFTKPVRVKTVHGAPDQPRDFQGVATSPNQIQLIWRQPSKLPKEYVVTYKSQAEGTRVVSVDGSATSYLLEDLTPNTDYQLRLRAIAPNGAGPETPVLIVTTQPFEPKLRPTDLTVTAPENARRQLLVQWAPPSSNDQYGKITHYQISWQLLPEPTGVPPRWPPDPFAARSRRRRASTDDDTADNPLGPVENHTLAPGDFDPNRTPYRYEITNLKIWSWYRVWVAAGTAAGFGPFTEPQFMRTQEDAPGKPRRLNASAINSTALLLQWNHPAPGKVNGIIRGYQVHYQRLAGIFNDRQMWEPNEIRYLNDNQTSYVLGSLRMDSLYKVSVVAYTRKGDGDMSDTVEALTQGVVPSKPVLRLTRQMNDQVQLSWELAAADKEMGMTVTAWRLSYYPVDNASQPIGDAVSARFEPHVTQNTTGQLQKGRVYEFLLAAENQINTGLQAVDRVTIPEGRPSQAPENITHKLLSENSLLLCWDPPASDHRNGKIVMYDVRFHLMAKPTEKFSLNTSSTETERTSVQVNDLPVKEQPYVFQIRAFTKEGPGPWSNPYQVILPAYALVAPRIESHEPLTAASARIRWSFSDSTNKISGYRVYSTNLSALGRLSRWNHTNTGGRVDHYDLYDLRAGADYRVRVAALDLGGKEGAISQEYSFRFDGIAPDAPRDIRCMILDDYDSAIQVTWSRPSVGSPDHYVIVYNYTHNFSHPSTGRMEFKQFGSKETQMVGPDLSYRIEDMRPGATYEIYIRTAYRLTPTPPAANLSGNADLKRPAALLDQKFSYSSWTSVKFVAPSKPPSVVSRPMVDTDSREAVTVLTLQRPSEERGAVSQFYVLLVPQKLSLNKDTYTFEIDKLPRASRGALDAAAPAAQGAFIYQQWTAQEFQVRLKIDPSLLNASETYRASLVAEVVTNGGRAERQFSPYSEPFRGHGALVNGSVAQPAGGGQTSAVSGAGSSMLLWIVVPAALVLLLLCLAIILFVVIRRRSDSKKALGGRKSTSPASPEEMKLLPTSGAGRLSPNAAYMPTANGGAKVTARGNGAAGADSAALLDHAHNARSDTLPTIGVTAPSMSAMHRSAISASLLAEHIQALRANDNGGYSQEYESIETGQQLTWDNSQLEVNKPKNRYANIIAYDHSRVILQPMEGLPGSDYINANYIDGYRRRSAYIATQGPLPETFGDFWRMVWEQHCHTIVMMSRLEERQRVKCDQYWPTKGTDTYGGVIAVTLLETIELATYTVRSLHIQHVGFPNSPERREIHQFQFTAWPDHGVPDHPYPLLQFIRRVRANTPADGGAVVVHCSAGVGRTGAFIVIDAQLERLHRENNVDIFGYVTHIRSQRNYMVQTEDQYVFVHDALLDDVRFGNTEQLARNLVDHVQRLLRPEPGEALTGMEKEFRRISELPVEQSRFEAALLPANKHKNRLVTVLPFESNRVRLQPIRGVDGSDYINASLIDGYTSRSAYIASQGPLPETADDLWRMLWEQGSCIVVMLTKVKEMGRDKCFQYWPTDKPARYQYFVVQPMPEYMMPQYILREFKVTDARDGQSRTIRQFQFTDWPEQGVPKTGEYFIDFIGQVHKTKQQFGHDGPITVHCIGGVGRTGVFITLSIVLDRMRYEGVCDMLQTVRMLHLQRPHMLQTEDQYQFCYQAAVEYLSSFDHFA